MEYLSIEDAVAIAEEMSLTVRDLGLLASAIARPQASAFGEDVYVDLPAKVAALIDSINRNHVLIDGNKRLSWLCGALFARLNGRDLSAAEDDAFVVIMAVAAGEMDLALLTDWVAAHIR